MKKLNALLLTGSILGSTMMTGLAPVMANDAANVTNDTAVMAMADKVTNGDFAKYINEIKGLSSEEKETLIQSKQKLAPTWEEIQKLEDEVNKIFENVVGDKLDDQYEAIFSKNEALWDKLYDGIGKKADTEDINDVIDSANFLSADEKATLKADQKKLDALDKQMKSLSDEAEGQAKSLYEQLDKLYAIVDQENAKNEQIWDKVFKDITPAADVK